MQKLKAWFWTSGRWFATPFFGGVLLIGVVLGGGSLASLNTWLAFFAAIFCMAGGHTVNTWLDVLTGLDMPGRGNPDVSAEKDYTAGCGLITTGLMSVKEAILNSVMWYAISAVFIALLATRVGSIVLVPWVVGIGVAFWYSYGKFNYTHELALATGPIAAAVLGGLTAGAWFDAFLVALPIVMQFSFAGLALDEWPDAPQNLKKGVRSIPYEVYKSGFGLSTYLLVWILFAYITQVFYIAIGILEPLTGITLILIPFILSCMPGIKAGEQDIGKFKKPAAIFVLVVAFYPILLLIGEIA